MENRGERNKVNGETINKIPVTTKTTTWEKKIKARIKSRLRLLV